MGSPEKPSTKQESVVASGVSTPLHTPGPWRLGPINYADVYSKDGELVALVIKGLDETAANARLIAAAPELRDALALYVEHFGDPLKVARAALARLTQPSLKPTVSKSPAGSASENEPTVTKEKGGNL